MRFVLDSDIEIWETFMQYLRYLLVSTSRSRTGGRQIFSSIYVGSRISPLC
jgi:hypothetical protein